jgi:hypothetical protein
MKMKRGHEDQRSRQTGELTGNCFFCCMVLPERASLGRLRALGGVSKRAQSNLYLDHSFGYRQMKSDLSAVSVSPSFRCTGRSWPSADPALPDLAKTHCFGGNVPTPPCDPSTDAKSSSGFRSSCGCGHHLLPTHPIKTMPLVDKINKNPFRTKAEARGDKNEI